MLNFVFVAPVNRLPVSETIKTLRDLYTNTGGRYHGGGFGKLAELAAEYVATHNGEFLTGTRVEQVLVKDGRVAGVATTDAELHAPVVVSNAGIQPTVLKYVDPAHLPSEYVERVRGLEPGWGFIGCRYFLDKPVLKSGIATAYSDQSWWDDDRYLAAQRGDWPDAALVFMGTTTNYDPSLAPAGHQIIQMGTVGSPDPEATAFNATVIEKAEITAREVWPEVFEHVVRRDPYTALQVSRLTRDAVVPGQGGECIGLGQVIGQCGTSKPDPRTPLLGLYLTGCDAGGYGCGTHQAVDSGFKVAEMLREDLA
jgi:prolycopene isomerase